MKKNIFILILLASFCGSLTSCVVKQNGKKHEKRRKDLDRDNRRHIENHRM